MLDKDLLGNIKKKLEADKASIEESFKGFADKDKKVAGDWDSRFPKFADEHIEESADEVEQYEAMLPVEFSLETRLRDITIALEKIAKGAYGKCEMCNKDIPEERLTFYPEARTCNTCRQKRVS